MRDDAFAGFLLGLLLAIIGLAGLVFAGKQTVTIDPRTRRTEVVDVSLMGRMLHLRDGKDYALFASGRFYEGASSRAVVEGWRERLHAYLAPVASDSSPTWVQR